ncbi:MAG: S-layer homology domain-containing protein [Oscillospiraceae bacterium]|nr:S-layer homology domain-containing protein [Oscillospiraceae bacterium]
MKKRFFCLLLILCMTCSFSQAFAADVPTEAEAYQKISAMKAKYPEGTPWSYRNYYSWKGGTYGGASSCMGFAMLLSDAAFGSLPARNINNTKSTPITIGVLRVGDILRLPGHSVVVLEKHSDHIIIAEGNYERRVHWGRKITAAQVARANYYTTRYPVGYTAPAAKAPEPERVEITSGGVTYKVSDIAKHWAREHIKECVSSGLLGVSGTADNAYFKPDDNANRAQIVTALYRAKGSPAPKYENSFTDIGEDWYRDAVSWASESGIVSGVTETSFAPDADVTREQIAVILYRFSGKESETSDFSAYADGESVSEYAKEALSWAVENSIISGKNGLLVPQGKTTRAELATMIVRFSMAMIR